MKYWTWVDWLIAVAVAIVGVAILLCWCGYTTVHSWGVKSGVVISKRYVPAHSDTYWHTVGSGRNSYSVPSTTYYGPEWKVDIQGTNSSGETLVRTLSLSEQAFDRCRTGDMVNQYGEPQ